MIGPVVTSQAPVRGIAAPSSHDGSQARAVARDFEKMVLSQSVDMMMKTAMPDLGAGKAGEMWRSVMAREIAGEIAASGATGLAESILPHIAAARAAEETDP